MEAPGEDRVLTIPNVLSVARLLCVSVFLWLLFDRHERTAAALLLGGLGATDFVDGYVARHFNQVSTVGKVLDPTADRILFVTSARGVLLEESVVTELRAAEADRLLTIGVFAGGIVPKLQAAVRAARLGVRAEIGLTAVLP